MHVNAVLPERRCANECIEGKGGASGEHIPFQLDSPLDQVLILVTLFRVGKQRIFEGMEQIRNVIRREIESVTIPDLSVSPDLRCRR